MKLKDLRLDVEALFSQAIYGHGFLHYGYWPKGDPDKLSLDKLSKRCFKASFILGLNTK